MRLDKFLAQQTSYSRKEITKLIKQQPLLVNQQQINNAAHKLQPGDLISFEGQLYKLEAQHIYLKFHKPVNYLSANQDSLHPTIVDLLPSQYRNLMIVGRLDLDTSGLIFLTSDGEWCHKITSPKYQVNKQYLVSLDRPIEDHYVARLAQGIQLLNEPKACLPASLEIIDSQQVILTISEGKYHQVRRMFAALGNHVVNLKRISIAGINLDNLGSAEFASLSPDELAIIASSLIKKAGH